MKLFPFSRLPTPPTEEELRRHSPVIEEVPAGAHRPFWSVMIPTYNRPQYLREALESVLCQDPGPERMQIEVLDNCSTIGDIERLVQDVGRGRVQYFRQPKPCSDNANACLGHSRGYWVHVLHDDDMLMPGFYEAYERIVASHPGLVMIAGKVVHSDSRGNWRGILGLDPDESGLAPAFIPSMLYDNQAQFAGLVVRRDAYEQVGGFQPV